MITNADFIDVDFRDIKVKLLDQITKDDDFWRKSIHDFTHFKIILCDNSIKRRRDFTVAELSVDGVYL